MRELVVQILHIFIIVVIVGFGVMALFAMAGGTDRWSQRVNRRSQNKGVNKGSA